MIGERELVDAIGPLTLRRLRHWVRRGLVQPVVTEKAIRFSDLDAARIRLICELRDELDVNEAALPVVLTLLDQVYGLRARMRSLVEALDDLPAPVRRDIRKKLAGKNGP